MLYSTFIQFIKFSNQARVITEAKFDYLNKIDVEEILHTEKLWCHIPGLK